MRTMVVKKMSNKAIKYVFDMPKDEFEKEIKRQIESSGIFKGFDITGTPVTFGKNDNLHIDDDWI